MIESTIEAPMTLSGILSVDATGTTSDLRFEKKNYRVAAAWKWEMAILGVAGIWMKSDHACKEEINATQQHQEGASSSHIMVAIMVGISTTTLCFRHLGPLH